MAQDPFNMGRHARLDAAHVECEIRRFLAEDVGRGDVTSDRVVPKAARARAAMVARQACVVAGLSLAKTVFLTIDPEIAFADRASDGDRVAAGAVLAVIEGPAGPLLTGERVALNLVQRLSGIATLTRAYVDAIAGTGACVSDTRKTTPGLRVFEKYAVHVGGGRNHRMGLYDAILIKDNHRAIAGGAAAAVMAARQADGEAMPVQVEVDALADLPRVLDLGVDAVLLDNMTPPQVAEAVRLARAHPRGRDCWIEASGGITLGSIRAYAEAGADTISVGALTHSAPAVDIALDIAAPDGAGEP
jgi:nicotinate-nucleotide pyrophosphorylase (carboxylating)